MKIKNIGTVFIIWILVACTLIPAQVPTQSIEWTSSLPSPSRTFTPEPTLVDTATPTPTLTVSQMLTYTPPVLFTPDPALIQNFVGTYQFIDTNASPCTLEIKNDATFSIEYIFTPVGWFMNFGGNLFFANGRFFLIPSKQSKEASPLYCFPQALIPVYWGERRYLFPVPYITHEEFSSDFISDFCDGIKTGKEPKNDISTGDNYYFLRERDVSAKVSGFPLRQDGQLLCQ
ncbi:MAG: hypothetical protein QM730_03650 [Anaerolineales bacterium]